MEVSIFFKVLFLFQYWRMSQYNHAVWCSGGHSCPGCQGFGNDGSNSFRINRRYSITGLLFSTVNTKRLKILSSSVYWITVWLTDLKMRWKTSVSWICLIVVLLLQSISAPGSGIWSDGKDKSEGAQAHTWNVEVLIDVLKELVSTCDPGFVFILTLCTQDFCCLFISFVANWIRPAVSVL